MLYTSAEANKLLNGLNSEHERLLKKERAGCTFTAATCENIEDVRPDYDYGCVLSELDATEEKIREVKHAINLFNVTHEIPGFGITIDRALVFLPQLTKRKAKLGEMSEKLPKTRQSNYSGSDLIEYEYANYDIARAEKDYQSTACFLARLQNALDLENSTAKFEIDI